MTQSVSPTPLNQEILLFLYRRDPNSNQELLVTLIPRHPSAALKGKHLSGGGKRRFRLTSLVSLILAVIVQSSFPGVSAQHSMPASNAGEQGTVLAKPRLTSGPALQQRSTGTLRGRVVDARSGEPVDKVKIIVIGSSQSATTDEGGIFTIQGVEPGEVDLYITTVGYGLVKKTLVVKEGDNPEVLLVLNQETATLTEQVTVTAGPYELTETNAVSGQTLNKTELQDLSKVVVNDPLRAVQSLPGVSANDDLRSEFAVRGAGYDRVGVYLDGILTDRFLHFAQGNSQERITLSVINSDTISAVTLLSGTLPAKYGDSTAAVLNLETRDGNRVKPAFRFATGLQLGTSGVADGPLANKRGSWLFAARSSLLDYVSRLVERAADDDGNSDGGNVDFNDVQGKFVYDLSPRHQLGLSGLFSVLRFDETDTQPADPNAVFEVNSRNVLASVFWNYTPNHRLLLQTRLFGTQTNFRNRNQGGLVITDEPRSQFGVRSDMSFLARPAHRVESGLYVRSLGASKVSNFFPPAQPGAPRNLVDFSRRADEQGYYLQDTYTNERLDLSLTGGARVDHSSLTGETLLSPRAALALAPGRSWLIRAGFGRHYQYPDFEPLFGLLGNPNLRAERATHYNASVERTFRDRYRALVEVYDREDNNLLFALADPRLVGGSVTFSALPFRNLVRGHARGMELTLQRRSANGLSGWVSYSYSHARLHSGESSLLTFNSDFDQRQTVNVYGSYRFTETFNVSGQGRYGSGLHIPGFFSQQGTSLFLAGERNLIRLPAYSRVDLRANKAFLFEKWKLTLSVELLNVLNHKNLRLPIIDGILPNTGQVLYHFGETMPVLPAVGVAIEF